MADYLKGQQGFDDFGPADAGLPSGCYVVDDSAGSKLSIHWSGLPPYFKLRIAAGVLVFSVLASIVIWAILGGVTELIQQIQQPRNDELIVGLFFGFFCLIVGWIGLGLMSDFVAYWREYTFDGQEHRFVARKKGWLGWRNQTVSIPLSRIKSLTWELGKEGPQPLPIKLYVRTTDADGLMDFHTFEFTLPEVMKRNQALDVMLRAGRAIQAKGYVIDKEEFRDAAARLIFEGDPLLTGKRYEDEDFDDEDEEDELDADEEDDEEEDEEDDDDDDDEDWDELDEPPLVHGIPAVGQSPAGLFGTRAMSVAGVRGRPAAACTHPLDLAKLNERLEFTKIADWRPGEEIHIVRPTPPKLIYIVATIFGAILGGVIGYWPLHGFLSIVLNLALGQGNLSGYGVAAAGAIAGATICAILAFNRFRHREVTLSWRRRLITEQLGEQLREWPLNEVRGVVVSDLINRGHQGEGDSSPAPTRYGGRIDLVLADRELLLVETDRWEDRQHLVTQLLAPLAHELSTRFDVPSTTDSEHGVTAGTDKIGWLEFSLVQKVILGTLVLAGLAGLFLAGRGNSRVAQAKERIRAAGGEVVLSGYTGPGDRPFLKDYTGVGFTEASDDTLQGLRPWLAALPDLGVRLEKTAVGPRGLAELANLPNLKLLNLSDTAVNDDGIAALGDLPAMVFLDLSVTPVSDDGLAKVAKQMPNLKFLYLPVMPRVTDAGIDHLQGLKKLEFLILPRQISPEAEERLKAAVPGLAIHPRGG